MRRSVALLALVAAGCGQQQDDNRRSGESDLMTMDASEPAADVQMSTRTSVAPPPPPAGPNVSPTAAPGVAFNYRYAFGLPSERIAQVQEQHAAACEQLGINRCRITGMRYRVLNDEDVEGMLAFKLDPAIARGFGKGGVEAVTRADGKLIDAEITGTDVGSQLKAAAKSEAQLTEELRRIEQQLARPGIRSDERVRLDYDAQQLRQQIRASRDNQDDQRESLATTPMVFEYGAGDRAPGFDNGPSIPRALDSARDNFVGGIAMLIVLLVTLLPWAAFALLAWALFRLVRPFVRRVLTVREPSVEPAPEERP